MISVVESTSHFVPLKIMGSLDSIACINTATNTVNGCQKI